MTLVGAVIEASPKHFLAISDLHCGLVVGPDLRLATVARLTLKVAVCIHGDTPGSVVEGKAKLKLYTKRGHPSSSRPAYLLPDSALCSVLLTRANCSFA